jgi:hypothetical protein
VRIREAIAQAQGETAPSKARTEGFDGVVGPKTGDFRFDDVELIDDARVDLCLVSHVTRITLS